MNKYDVIFQFKHGPVVVQVEAETEKEAIEAARTQEVGTPVPDFIPVTVNPLIWGGKRQGAGPKQGVRRVKSARTVRKYIRWTEEEWVHILEQAKLAEKKTADYQRGLLLFAFRE